MSEMEKPMFTVLAERLSLSILIATVTILSVGFLSVASTGRAGKLDADVNRSFQTETIGHHPSFENYTVIRRLSIGHVPAYVGADNGTAFFLFFVEGKMSISHVQTSMPVFKAFGILPLSTKLVYSPLKNRIPSGELVVEDLETGVAEKVSSDLIIGAQVSPLAQQIAYTFATGEGFGLAVIDANSALRKVLVSTDVLPDFIQWDGSGRGIYYFETTGEIGGVGVVAREVSAENGKLSTTTHGSLPESFPNHSSQAALLDRSSREFSSTHAEIHFPFEIVSEDRTKRICGGNLFGNAFIQLCETFDQSYLAEGKLLKVLNEGVIVRVFEEHGTAVEFIDWRGVRTQLAESPQVSFNKPLSTFVLTQGGSSYPAPGNCSISSHTGALSFAYDMQNSTVGKHIMSSAEGLVVYVVENVNCNSCDANGCATYSSTCSSNGGWGNTVIVEHSDESWTKYSHMQFNSVPVQTNATACHGLYLGNQGHTGCSAGNLNGCGDHLHFQRQSSAGRDGVSVSSSFSDSSNPLACLSSYTSASSETSVCSSCQSGTSTQLNRDGGPPIHPPGSLLKAPSPSTTVYLIDREGLKRPITSASVLANLYGQSNADFTSWVVTVSQSELDLYEQGPNLSSALPGNGKAVPDGKLIGFNGEISIVTGAGKRRPFTSASRFTGLGYNFCQVQNLATQSDYNSYPVGPPVDAMPMLTSSVNLNPAGGPYSVGQNISGTFSIKNVGFESFPFANLGIGGRINGSTVFDLNFIPETLTPGETFSYSSNPRQMTTAGTYEFFAAHQESNQHWTISVPAAPGVVRKRQIQVGASCPSPSSISVGQTINGTLQNGDCLLPADGSYYDAYTFTGTAGQQIYITLNSTQFNAYLYLVQGAFPGGTTVMQNDNGGGGTNARIPPTSGFVTLPASGVYTILANSFSPGETGSYQLFLGGPTCNPPGSFSLTFPSNGQTLSSTNSVTLQWGASANADSYDVYFGTNSNPPFLANQTGTNRVVTVTPGQSYWWKIVAKVNCSSDTATSSTWSFSVQTSCNSPGSFSLNSPPNGQNISSTNSVTLSWGSSLNADSYDVYFGTSSNPPFLANQTGTSRVVNVSPGQSYWWKVVAKVSCGPATVTSATWAFSVQTASCTYSLNPTSHSFPASGGNNSFQVNTQAGCMWTAVPTSSLQPEGSDHDPKWWNDQPEIVGLPGPWPNRNSSSTYGTSNPSPEATFTGTGTGPIPDSTVTGPQSPGSPLNISFGVSGLSGVPTNVEISMTANHSFVGDLKAVLIAPNGTAFTVFGYTGALSTTDFGSSSDLNGIYSFTDSASGTNWWTAAASTPVPAGGYRSTLSGPTSNPAPVTNLTGAFSGVTNPNGTWILRVTDGAAQDTGSVTAASLTLSASPPSSWITITSGSSGTGSGSVNYAVTTNTSTNPRSGTITVNGQVHTVNQAAAGGCNYSLPNPPANTVGPGNGGGSFPLSTTSGCSWTAVSDSPSWLTTSSSGTGSNIVQYSFTANPTTSTRTGNILVGGQSYAVTQIGLGGAGSVQFSSANYTVNEGGGAATVTITRTSGISSGTVSFSTSNGTATAGLDYAATSEFLLFAEGVTSRTVQIPIHEDILVEGNETINLSLTNPSNSLTMGSPSSGVLTIVDNDSTPSGRKLFDYDGDARVDFSVFRPSSGAWYLQRTTAGFFGIQFGINSDKLAPADFDGDGKTDIAVYRPSAGQWYVLNSATGTVTYPVFGVAEDVPAPGDYDGDGKADLAVFRPSQGTWYRQNSSNGTFFGFQFGATGDVPTVGDFDGDGKNDLGIWRPSNGDWYNIRSSNGSVFGERFGQTGDKIAPADYDGDGKTDIAIFRPSTGLWVVRNSATSTYSYSVFGAAADIPVAGDYDGDGKADIGVWRPSDGTWYISRSSNGQFTVFPWGQNGDRPTPSAFGN
jgi:subtilisin-like proprotein convertase family protein